MLGNSEMENCIFNFISRILIDTSKVKAEAEKHFSFYSPPSQPPRMVNLHIAPLLFIMTFMFE